MLRLDQPAIVAGENELVGIGNDQAALFLACDLVENNSCPSGQRCDLLLVAIGSRLSLQASAFRSNDARLAIYHLGSQAQNVALRQTGLLGKFG